MPISSRVLRSASSQFVKSAGSLTEARFLNLRTVFLCHSHHDAELSKGLISLFASQGWKVYVDWEDSAMPETPNRETAERIQQKIRQLDYFVFLATEHSVRSRWCPWEIGFADSEKENDSILIVPTSDDSGKWYGNEYLQLYRKIDLSDAGNLNVWNPGQEYGFSIRTL